MLYKSVTESFNEFIIDRSDATCIRCKVCVRQCAYEVHAYEAKADALTEDNTLCIGCRRCSALCPTGAITIRSNEEVFKRNESWSNAHIRNLYAQADTGGILLAAMGNPAKYPIYWDHMLLDASQVTNPSIDPLREPMELRTYLGKKPHSIEVVRDEQTGKPKLATKLTPQIKMEYPFIFSAMSYGALNLNAHKAMAMAAKELGTLYNTGEGGLHRDLYQYGSNVMVQVASGRFGVSEAYLNAGVAIEIKVGQGAKPGIGGHLPGEKVNDQISETRMIPAGADAISPAPHHDIYSIEDLRQLIFALKEATNYTKPVSVKIAAVHHVAAIASGVARAGADIITIDGFRGGTGAAPQVIRDNVGIPMELALAAVDARLRDEGIRNQVSIVVGGGVRSSGDAIKAIALGADAINMGTSTLLALGCTLCQRCYTGKCPWGITTNNPYLAKRLNPELGAERLVNLVHAWGHEMKEILGGMGLNALESLRGNRYKLRALGLTEKDMNILGVMPAGE
ncbi:NADPH-dependent glutamate synthase, iron-sulfur cluster-binding and FMN-binding subunit [Geobacter metallireducens GS-15]|uniref:glutamate synthase (NADPH) n=1 Tax=Geobacter metallireducens (strain ATCC 53774 / DSM 7210 / GS-15) TaxID=269799 RepID=Q39UT7_GEOMG|nr:glutamate synthase-related protein [Geobacter metallireducens]ABB31987.1 NADPH-dependent glutamate synthase, iron-sulfur cluster-binding and FMN-binding subunit [Geobacter metallireducens GS-15]